MSSKHLKEVPLLGLAKAKALALSNANLLARNIDPQKSAPCRIASLTFSFVFCPPPPPPPLLPPHVVGQLMLSYMK